MWLITEFASLFDGICTLSIVIFWLLITSIIGLLLYSHQSSLSLFQLTPQIFKIEQKNRITLLGLGIILTTLIIIALIAPPNNWDSMTYHMSRVMHWIQNHNVKHYPTHITKQIFLNPGAEFFILHLQLLTGSDRFANLVQWFSMLGSMIVVSLIAKCHGANRSGQLLGAVLIATLPMGILQATSTQNDYAVSFLLTCFVYYCLMMIQNMKNLTTVMAGCALGLAFFTKATAYLYAFPFLLWLAIKGIRKRQPTVLLHLIILVTCALVINSGHYYRNFKLYNHPFAPRVYRGFNINKKISLPVLCSNIIRNVSLHCGTPHHGFNMWLTEQISGIHEKLGVDIIDPDTTYGAALFSIFFSNHEDTAGNSLQFLLIIVSVIILLFRLKKYNSLVSIYLLILILSFLLFCTYIRWNPWNSRYHLPLFILISPVVAFIVTSLNKRFLTSMLIILLFVSSIPWLLWNYSRPIAPIPDSLKNIFTLAPIYSDSETIFQKIRTDMYFVSYPEVRMHYIHTSNILKQSNCHEIGLIAHEGILEYPLWVLLGKSGNYTFKLHHLKIRSQNRGHGVNFEKNFKACSIIVILPDRDDNIEVNKMHYHKIWSSGPIDIMIPVY